MKIPKAIGRGLSGVKEGRQEDTPSPRQRLLRRPGWSVADLLWEKKALFSGWLVGGGGGEQGGTPELTLATFVLCDLNGSLVF